MNRPEEEQGLDQGIFPSQPKHITPSREEITGKKQWKPWHRPRKQWIRLRQWNAQISQLIDELHLVDRPLRYLSLPGEDLLDIRVIHDLCEEKNVQLKCLGFDDGTYSPETEAEINISRNEVFQSPLIFPGSDIIKDDFVMVSDKNSQAYKVAKQNGPYDIINLDLCGSFSRRKGRSYYDAFRNLINDIQIKEWSQPWLFFLTTRADIAVVNRSDLPHHWINLRNNVQRSDTFKARLDRILDDRFEQINGNVQQELPRLKHAKFGRLFALCIAKWLLRFMLSGSPLWVTEMLDSCWYRVSSTKTPNMLSLAFRFHQVTEPRQDPAGLTDAPDPPIEEVDEAVLAIAALTKTESLVDIDRLLIENPALNNDMVKESKKLLGSARYPIKEYIPWASKKQKSMIRKLRN